jgi:signal transduction histidine kinase
MSLRVRFLLSFALVIAVLLLGVSLFMRSSTQAEVHAYLFRGGLVGVEDLVTDLEDFYQANGTWQGAETLLESQTPQTPVGTQAGQGQGPGRQGQGSNQAGGTRGLSVALPDGTIAAGAGLGEQLTLNAADLANAIPLEVNNQTVGYLYSHTGFYMPDQGFEQDLLARLDSALRNAALISGAVALALALLLAYFLSRPIRQLTGAAARMAEGDLSQRVETKGPQELASLGQAFNHMASSLEQAESSRKAMTADIAHELRTPLAVQRASLEALQDGIYDFKPENLTPLLEQNRLLTRLVEDLRTLALAEAGQLDLQRTPSDLAGLCAGLASRFQASADQRNIAIRINLTSECPPVMIDQQRIEQILTNLLQNALRHTPTGGVIQISLTSQMRQQCIQVQDSGPGIPEDALPHIFERFYRADSARSRPEGGTGLGLSIARQLAEAHGGSLMAANHPNGGAVFTLCLPED